MIGRISAWIRSHLDRSRRAVAYRLIVVAAAAAGVAGWLTQDQVVTVIGYAAALFGVGVAAAATPRESAELTRRRIRRSTRKAARHRD